MKKTPKFLLFSSLIVLGSLFVLWYALAWDPPTNNPPLDNLDSPLNAGSDNQSKEGYLAIATSTAPNYPLDVAGTIQSTGFKLPTGAAAAKVLTSDASGVATWQTAAGGAPAGSTGYIQFNNAGAFGADSGLFWDNTNKRLGIGTTAPGEKLSVNGNIGASSFNLLGSTSYRWVPGSSWNTFYTPSGYIQLGPANTSYAHIYTDRDSFYFNKGATFVGSVTASAFYYSSDESLKKNVQKIETPLAKIMKLDGISFNWKENGEKSIGLIAQDVEKIFPELVKTDANSGLKSIQYAQLVSPLIEAVKEQQNMISQQGELIKNQGKEIEELKIQMSKLGQ